MQGYGEVRDNFNVAIHEMAHGLEHESFINEIDIDPDFRVDFAKLSSVSEPVFAGAIVNHESDLRNYAFTNM